MESTPWRKNKENGNFTFITVNNIRVNLQPSDLLLWNNLMKSIKTFFINQWKNVLEKTQKQILCYYYEGAEVHLISLVAQMSEGRNFCSEHPNYKGCTVSPIKDAVAD